ncbi:MBL fold metallo-hydrolase [Rugosimonospora acidiphila]|uniref:MBL fold metallo-hydrolase n=1 Tax=Rugosimonospora acidiphila TaxID=556531 RepID=UPI003CD0BC6C
MLGVAAAAAAAAGVAGLAAAWVARDVSAAYGASPEQVRARLPHSPQLRGNVFHNREQTRTLMPETGQSTLRELLFGGQRRKPSGPIPVLAPPAAPARAGLQVTWYGHASALLEIGDRRVLVDPVWSPRCSPSPLAGPRRLHPVPVPLDLLPELDAILISHDHYDHLDMPTVQLLVGTQSAPFVVPLGVGAHLDRWGVPPERIIELDWDGSVELAGGLRLTATPARHFSGRLLTKRNYTLWCSWVVSAPVPGGVTRRVYYTGDTGYFDGYPGIAEAYGPFDATLIQVGAYDARWPEIHMTPEEAVQAHLELRGGLLIPVHWATFVLAFHAWSEPVDRLWQEAKARGVTLAVPRPGERVDVDSPPPVDGWWQAIA